MSLSILPEEREQTVNVAYKKPNRLDWVVREDPKIQEELNKLTDTGEELSSDVVNKVLDRIKGL